MDTSMAFMSAPHGPITSTAQNDLQRLNPITRGDRRRLLKLENTSSPFLSSEDWSIGSLDTTEEPSSPQKAPSLPGKYSWLCFFLLR